MNENLVLTIIGAIFVITMLLVIVYYKPEPVLNTSEQNNTVIVTECPTKIIVNNTYEEKVYNVTLNVSVYNETFMQDLRKYLNDSKKIIISNENILKERREKMNKIFDAWVVYRQKASEYNKTYSDAIKYAHKCEDYYLALINVYSRISNARKDFLAVIEKEHWNENCKVLVNETIKLYDVKINKYVNLMRSEMSECRNLYDVFSSMTKMGTGYFDDLDDKFSNVLSCVFT